jgi:hypothetical protein
MLDLNDLGRYKRRWVRSLSWNADYTDFIFDFTFLDWSGVCLGALITLIILILFLILNI